MSNPLSGMNFVKLHEVSERARQEAAQQSRGLVAALGLSCEVAAAQRMARAKSPLGGNLLDVDIFEIACASGTGYIVQTQGPEKPYAMTCFAADAVRVAGGPRDPDSTLTCELPANQDIKAIAAALLTAAGTACPVEAFRWFGTSASHQTDYSEVACAGGAGYLLLLPLEGPAPVSVMGCREAAKQGLRCRLTEGGPVARPVTLQTLREALHEKTGDCEPSDLRLIGREQLARRYVVEARCPQRPGGLVAFIPLGETPGTFEAIDCAAAAARHIVCQYPGKP